MSEHRTEAPPCYARLPPMWGPMLVDAYWSEDLLRTSPCASHSGAPAAQRPGLTGRDRGGNPAP